MLTFQSLQEKGCRHPAKYPFTSLYISVANALTFLIKVQQVSTSFLVFIYAEQNRLSSLLPRVCIDLFNLLLNIILFHSYSFISILLFILLDLFTFFRF